MKTSRAALLALGLGSSVLAAPIPAAVVAVSLEVQTSQITFPAGTNLPPAPRMQSPLSIDASDAFELDPVAIDNKPVTPSSTVLPADALGADVPIHTTYLMALYKHRPHAASDESVPVETGVPRVPDTVSATSYARIEAGLSDLYPEGVRKPCAGGHHQHDVVVIALVCFFLLALLVAETWVSTRTRYVAIIAPEVLSEFLGG